MDVNTGHLVTAEKMAEMMKLSEMMKLAEGAENEPLEKYEPVPEELRVAAEKKLAGKDEAYVSLTSGGKLSKWAAKQRKAKQHRKMQKASRRANR